MRFVLSVAALVLLLGTAAFGAEEYPAVAVVERVKDSVVSIDANQVTFGVALGIGDEIARQQRLLTNTLTGFIYTADGYIITDSQDIESAVLINVIMADGTELEGEVVGLDEDYGIGVIKVSPEEPLKPVELLAELYDPKKDSYPYDQGDPIIAIGYSGGLGGTVTTGIIGAIRNFRNANGILVPNMIQADTVINAGNEGCPLFNNDGKVIGFHDRRASSGRGPLQNVTFFMPVWLVKRVADEIIKNYEEDIEDPEVWHPWLGIKPFSGSRSTLTGDFRTVSDDLKMFMDIPDQYWDVGVLVDTVFQESPAREFGLRDKDMLLEVTVLWGDTEENRAKGIEPESPKHERQFIKKVQDLELMVTTADRGDIFIFGVLRAGRYFNVEVVIGQHPGAFVFALPAGQFIDVEVSNEYF